MTPAPRLLPLVLLVLAVAGPVRAAEPEAVATAPAASSGAPAMSVSDQIDTYLKTSPAAQVPKDKAMGVTSGEDEPRKVHGVFDVAVGTGGYRSAYVRSDVPVGKTGTLSIAASETKFDGRAGRGFAGPYGGAGQQSLSIGLALGGADALDPHDPRCRQVREDGPDASADPRFEGGRPHICRPADVRTSP